MPIEVGTDCKSALSYRRKIYYISERSGVKNGKVQSLKAGNYKVTDFRKMTCGLMGFAINGGPYFFHVQTGNTDLNFGCLTLDRNQWVRFKTTIETIGGNSDFQQTANSRIIDVNIQGNVLPKIKYK